MRVIHKSAAIAVFLTSVSGLCSFGHHARTAENGLTPHGLGVEETYTITTVLKLLPPCDPTVMTDAYQDVRVLRKEGEATVVSITYFPLNDAVRAKRLARYATGEKGLSRYLKPTTTCNWDQSMRKDLLAALRKDGIDPARLSRRDLVAKVSEWAFGKSQFDGNPSAMPPDWFVVFRNGRPQVPSSLRSAFNASKNSSSTSDEDVFARQLLGRQMFAQRRHGACTSSSIYLATILRSLGIPTRILYFVPACDGNDETQVKSLLAAVSRKQTNRTIRAGLRNAKGFANHMFNEVWIDGRWVRLNYTTLDQEIVDESYLGLLTHTMTCADIEETHLAETWGKRVADYPRVSTPLKSINPYQLLAASDHWGKNATKSDPAPIELKECTIYEVAQPGSPHYQLLLPTEKDLPKTDFLFLTKEWLAGRNYVQLREFSNEADGDFTLKAEGLPDVRLSLNGLNVNTATLRGFAARILEEDRAKLHPGATYTLVPANKSKTKNWKVEPGLTVIIPKSPKPL